MCDHSGLLAKPPTQITKPSGDNGPFWPVDAARVLSTSLRSTAQHTFTNRLRAKRCNPKIIYSSVPQPTADSRLCPLTETHAVLSRPGSASAGKHSTHVAPRTKAQQEGVSFELRGLFWAHRQSNLLYTL